MKTADIKNLSKEELQAQLAEAQTNYTKLVLAHKISPVQNPISVRDARRNIARIHTAITNKQ